MGSPNISVTGLVVAAMGFSLAAALGEGSGEPTAPLTVHDVGEYAAVPWEEPGTPIAPGSREDRVRDLTFAVASVNINDDTSDESLQQWAEVARWGREQGKKLLPRVHFWDGKDRYDGPMRDLEVYWRRLDRFLSAVNVRDLHGIVLAEENVPYAGRPEVLTELYRRVKAKYPVAVWQWWSPKTAVPGSGGWIPADGWVIDPYMLGGRRYRQYLRKYVISGKPIVVMPWSSVMGGSVDEEWFEIADGQLAAAVEFGLPVAFFWCSGTTCYFGGDRNARETLMDRNNQRVWSYIRRVRALPADFRGFPSADFGYVGSAALAADEAGVYCYEDDFTVSRCVDDASMTGFRDLAMDGDGLKLRGFAGRRPAATLTYRFVTDRPVKCPEVNVECETSGRLGGTVTASLSADGRDWACSARGEGEGRWQLRAESTGIRAFASASRFWVRVQMTGTQPGSDGSPVAKLRGLKVTTASAP